MEDNEPKPPTTGKRTRRHIIESDITEEPDSAESDVSGSDSSDT